jgi:hypothetical protein
MWTDDHRIADNFNEVAGGGVAYTAAAFCG